ncbi:MAG TPA: endonuclease/exonuclease/phosphatase family protein [Usitatibacter sp.]|jgi:endonuclease/exonuclease/phosphatase family metal-dependent hydrolase|nr:endonuclease/exonuclease/phosphatase family protein [Usitatibacter sp.]
MTARALTVVTYNIHKGLSQFNRRLVLHEIRDRLGSLDADVAFLQEVQGRHEGNAKRHVAWPEKSQHEFLCRDGAHSCYGMNAVYQDGHHGNAVVSRFPISCWDNIDISHHPIESRGLLHCELEVQGWKKRLHCINVHLGLWARSRRFQLEWLADRIRGAVPEGEPLIVAGDFNDWQKKASDYLAAQLKLVEVFEQSEGRLARSYPAKLPMLPLDRIYVRGLGIQGTERLVGLPWSRLSDHVALAARLAP